MTNSAAKPHLEPAGSRQLTSWMAEQSVSFAFTTYQSGKLFLIGLQPDQRLSVFERTFNRCMGLWGDGQTLWMMSLYQMWRFENVIAPGQSADGCDRLYVAQAGYTTGDLDIHDVAVDSDGRVIFVNTLFGCLATLSDTHSFVPLWQPPFLSRLARPPARLRLRHRCGGERSRCHRTHDAPFTALVSRSIMGSEFGYGVPGND